MKKLILLLSLLVGPMALAEMKINDVASCDRVSNKQLAEDLLLMIRSGNDQGIGNKKCASHQALRFTKMADEGSDLKTNRLMLVPGDTLKIVGPVVEGQDEDGGTNEFVVKYEIISASGKVIRGDFSYSRVTTKGYFEELGCAVIQQTPKPSFIDQSCL